MALAVHRAVVGQETAACEHPIERKDGYARRRPEDTALYQCVAEHWGEFAERVEEAGGLPSFVREEFEQYLTCGRLEHGCLELQCRSCGHSELVAFSCKRRGFCPGCLGRRMSDGAVHLVQDVLPEAPVRHWVCTFPWGVRSVLGYDRALCREAVSGFMKELSRSLRHRAKDALGLGGVKDALTGAVAVVRGADGELAFHALPTPTSDDVLDIARRTAKRLHRAFRKQGRHRPWDEPDFSDGEPEPFSLEQPGLFACYQAAALGAAVLGERAGQPVLRLVAGGATEAGDKPNATEPVAEALGVNVYAKQLVDGRDRAQLERLARYVLRPPLSQERLERRDDGRLQLTLKSVWKDGTRALLLEPHALLVRLCAAIPPPGFHMTRYFGVLSSHSAHRHEVVPALAEPERFQAEPAEGDQLALAWGDDVGTKASGRSRRRGNCCCRLGRRR
jgi:hypothetical protein